MLERHKEKEREIETMRAWDIENVRDIMTEREKERERERDRKRDRERKREREH